MANHISYNEIIPPESIFGYIKNYWKFENTTQENQFFTILPDGCFDLIVKYTGNHLEKVLLTGLWTKQIDIAISAKTTLLGVRFKLLSADILLKQKIATSLNSSTILNNYFWNINTHTPKNLYDFYEKINHKITTILSDSKDTDNRKQLLFNILDQTKGDISVKMLSEQAFWSPRQINRYFSEWFGISLKKYCSILRVFASYNHIKKGQLFPRENYYDQAHFIKEIKLYTGVKPSDLYQNKNDRFLQLLTNSEK